MAPSIDAAPSLIAAADAITTAHLGDLTPVRRRLVDELGEVAAERAIGVAATFQMMNRALDGVGAPVARELHSLAAELGFDPADLPR